MEKAIFRDLIKIASQAKPKKTEAPKPLEKKAYGFGGWGYSPYGGMGMGGAPTIRGWGRGGGYMMPHPAFVPGMLAQQYSDLPHMGIGAQRGYEQLQRGEEALPGLYEQTIQNLGAGAQGRIWSEGRDDRNKYEQQKREADARVGAMEGTYRQKLEAANAAEREMMASPWAKSRAGRGEGFGGLIGDFGNWFGLGSAEHGAWSKARSEADAAHAAWQTQQSAAQREAKDLEARLSAAQERQRGAEQHITGQENQLRGGQFGHLGTREHMYNEAAGRFGQGQAGSQNVAGSLSGMPRVGANQPRRGLPMITPSHAPNIPSPNRFAPPNLQPFGKLGSDSMIDALAEGAARNLIEKYARIAAAKVAADFNMGNVLANSRLIGQKSPEELRKGLVTQQYMGQSPGGAAPLPPVDKIPGLATEKLLMPKVPEVKPVQSPLQMLMGANRRLGSGLGKKAGSFAKKHVYGDNDEDNDTHYLRNMAIGAGIGGVAGSAHGYGSYDHQKALNNEILKAPAINPFDMGSGNISASKLNDMSSKHPDMMRHSHKLLDMTQNPGKYRLLAALSQGLGGSLVGAGLAGAGTLGNSLIHKARQ